MPDADDELAGGAVVRLRYLLQAVVDAVHGEGQPAGRDAGGLDTRHPGKLTPTLTRCFRSSTAVLIESSDKPPRIAQDHADAAPLPSSRSG